MIHDTDRGTAVNVRPETWLLRARNDSNADEPQDDTAGDSVRAVDRALDILLAFKP